MFTTALVLLVFALGFAVMVFLVVRSQGGADKRRLAVADEQGWVVVPPKGRELFHFEGTNEGVSWTLAAVRPQSSGQQRGRTQTFWRTKRPPAPAVVFLGPTLPAAAAKLLGSKVVDKALDLLVGDDATQLRGLALIDLRDDALAARYSVVAQDRDTALAWIEPGRQVLLAFPGSDVPVVGRWKDELFVRVDGPVDDPAVLRAMVGLGVTLAGSP